jgi:ferredoxin
MSSIVRMLFRPRGWRGLAAAVAIAIALVFVQTPSAFACEISISPSDGEPTAGEQEQVVVTVIQTHKTCVTPIEDTIIQFENLNIVSEGDWQDIDGGHEKELMVSFTQPGEATLTIIRECSKGGDTAVATFNVQPATLPTGTSDNQPPPSSDPTASSQSAALLATTPTPIPGTSTLTPVTSAGTDGGTTSSGTTSTMSSKTSDLGSQIVKTLEEPKTIAVAMLLAVAAFGYIRGYQRLRRIVMLVSLGYLGFYIGGCLCPLGAVQNLALSGTTLKAAFLVTLALPLVATLLLGRLYCGWVCPAGALQEIVHSEKNATTVPPGLHRWLKYLKYVALVALIAAVRLAGEPVFERWDPFRLAWDLDGTLIPLMALGAIIIASVFIYRPWCRYLCPMGAVFALASRFSLLRLAPESSCVGCKLCVKNCASQSLAVDGETKRVTIDHGECMSCGACRSVCRKEGLCLSPRLSLKKTGERRSDAKNTPTAPERIGHPASEVG